MAAAPSESLDDYDDIDLETVCPMTDEEVKRVQAKIKLLGAALPRPPMPQVPTFAATTPSVDKLRRMQRFIESLQYNYTDTTYFSVRKNRPLHQILGTAREIIRDALPIRCLEAVFLALHLTQGMTELERFPVSFKSTVGGQCYRHIVLAIKVDGKFGAMGLSRRSTLMFKDFTYASFGDLIVDFRDAYEECFHRLLTVNTGLPISHNDYRAIPICWRCLKVKLFKHEWALLHDGLNAYVKDCSKLLVTWERTGKKPDVSQYSHDKPKEAGGEATAGDEGAAAAQSKTEMDASGILDSDEEDDEAERAEEQAEVVSTTGNSSANRDAAV